MKTLTLDVRTPADAMADFTQAWNTGKSEKSDRISFASPELIWRVLTAKRWELLKVLCGAGPVSIREAARRAGRDVKAVHGDVTALLKANLTQASLAEKLGIRQNMISDYERGKRRLSPEMAARIAEILDIKADRIS